MARYSPSGNTRERYGISVLDSDSPRYSYSNALFQHTDFDVRSVVEARVSASLERRRWSFGRHGRSELYSRESLGREEELQGDGA